MNIRSCAAALLAVLALAAPARVVTAADPIEIPSILPLTGGAAFLGRSFSETLKTVEERTNKSGGINGRPIHFAIQDDQSTAQVAVQLTNAAIAKNPPIIINGGPVANCLAVVSLVKNGPLLWCLSPSLRADASPWAFGVMSSSRDFLQAGMTYFKNRGFKRIAVLNGTDATGSDGDEILGDLIKLPEYAGMSFVDYEHFNLADMSVGAQVARIKASGAQALFSYTTGAPIATVLHGLADAGMDIPVFSSNGNMSIVQLDGYKSFVPKELIFGAYPAFDADPVADGAVKAKIAEFRSDMKGAGVAPDLLHAIPWDPAFLMVDALRKAGPNGTAAQVRDAVSNVTNWAGLMGRYDFKALPNRGIGLKAVIMLKWDPAHSDFVGIH